MANFKDICQKFDASVLQQLYKKITKDDNTLGDKNVFPVALVQGVYDAISGMRLDDILTHYNYINLEFKGSQSSTRLAIPIAHRRTYLIISYTDYDNANHIEQYIGNNINDVDWQKDSNWKTPFTEGNFIVNVADNVVEEITNNYLDNYFEEHPLDTNVQNTVIQEVANWFNSTEGETFINNAVTNATNNYVQQYINDNLSDEQLAEIITNYLDENITTICQNYFTSEAGQQAINDAIAPQLEEIVGEYFTAIQTYLQDNERVIANALARHEQAITDLQN